MRFNVLRIVQKTGVPTDEVHAKLFRLLEYVCEQNTRQKFWRSTPCHLADCLHVLFPQYPEPEMADDGALVDYGRFIETGRKLLIRSGRPWYNLASSVE